MLGQHHGNRHLADQVFEMPIGLFMLVQDLANGQLLGGLADPFVDIVCQFIGPGKAGVALNQQCGLVP
ncbi:MAG: hypothetical protein WKF63_00810, partial [Thermomicrobiales bacterium]